MGKIGLYVLTALMAVMVPAGFVSAEGNENEQKGI